MAQPARPPERAAVTCGPRPGSPPQRECGEKPNPATGRLMIIKSLFEKTMRPVAAGLESRL